jgi:hypothetical protein
VLWARPFYLSGYQKIIAVDEYFFDLHYPIEKFFCASVWQKNFKIRFDIIDVSSFAIFGLWVNQCELQMSLHQ